MTPSVPQLQKLVSVGEISAGNLSEAIAQVKESLQKQRYHEASDLLDGVQLEGSCSAAEVELWATRAILQILCQMALSNLKKAQTAWEELEDILAQHPQFNNSEIMLLGARLHWASGDIDEALYCSKEALSLARCAKENILSQAVLARIEYGKRGEACLVLEQLMPHWSALRADCSYSDESKILSGRLRLALAVAALAQGKLHLAREVIGCVGSPKTMLDLEMHLLNGITQICAGESELAIRAAQDADIIQLSDGSCRQERGSILWWQTWIFHATGVEREAQQRAEDLHDLISASSTDSFRAHGELLLASCLIQRKNVKRASQLVEKYLDEESSAGQSEKSGIKLNAPLRTMLLLCEALILYEGLGMRRARAYLIENRDAIFNLNSLLTLCLMCHAHEQLLVLLCKCFGVAHLPSELVDLLDTQNFQSRYLGIERQLQQSESARLQKKFSCCSGQIKDRVQREKPLEIRLFGGLEVRVKGNLLDLRTWGNSKTRTLFISLALGVGTEFAREMLMERLWPEQLADDVRSTYNVTWCQMRRRILDALPLKSEGELEFIYDSFQNTGGRCVLKEEEVYVDTKEFENLSAKLSDYLRSDNKSACLATIKRIAEIYQGELLPGDRYLEWLDLERRYYHRQFLDAMLLGADICLKNNEPESAFFYLGRISSLEANNEELHYLSMKAYAVAGRREEAMHAYHNCRRYLHDELGLDPSQRIMDLYQELLCEST